jgi:hypothetical protein
MCEQTNRPGERSASGAALFSGAFYCFTTETTEVTEVVGWTVAAVLNTRSSNASFGSATSVTSVSLWFNQAGPWLTIHFDVPNELAARRLLPKQTDLTLAVVRDR